MINIIPINPATIQIITELNGGLEPVLEEEDTFFVYKGPDTPPSIISQDALQMYNDEWWTVVKILFHQ